MSVVFKDAMRGFKDRLSNLVSGLGTSKDKNVSNQYVVSLLTPDQLLAAYSDSWIAAKIVDIPADDATREWRNWQAKREEITKLEALEKQFHVRDKLKEALIKARLLGGAAIVIGVEGAGEWNEELDLDRIKEGSLKYLHVVDRSEINPSAISRDLDSKYYGHPTMYTTTSGGTAVEIHPSRVVRLIGRAWPIRAMEADGWGQSVLQPCDKPIKDAELACTATATLINEASIDIIRIPEFMDSMGDEEYRGRVITRFQLAATAKSLVRATLLDKEEEWDKLQTSFAGLPDLIDKFLGIAAAAADIPATRMLSQSPGGLNATGDSDIRNYYDSIKSMQASDISMAIGMLDEVIIRSALGSRPEEIHYVWAPLWQPSDSEKAETLVKKTTAIGNIYNTGYIDDSVMSKAVANMLVEDGSLPGLDAALEEFENSQSGDLDEEDEEVRNQFNNPDQDDPENA